MIRHRAIREPGLVGTLFEHTDGSPRPGVIVLPGSEGGLPDHVAALLAAQGRFTCLALAYFGVPGLPRRLVDVPLETVERAAHWLAATPATRPGPIGLLGGSKGAELALLAASELPGPFGPVVAFAPSSVAWAGVEFLALDRRILAGLFGTASRRSSWSLRGKPVPYLHHAAGALPRVSRHGISVSPSFERALDDQHGISQAAIAAERVPGRILLVSGDDDRMWPSSRMATMIVERLEALSLHDKVRHLRFPTAGHRLEPPAPATGIRRLSFVIDYGGDPIANEKASTGAWRAAVTFLSEELNRWTERFGP
jgi:uncharacterized protein